MAMSKGLKIGLGVMAVGITGTIVYMLIKKMKNKKDEQLVGGGGSGDTPPVIVHPTTTLPQPTPPVTTPVGSAGSIPFTNRTEGNAFRGWINDTYPTYAAEIDLDRTGSYNNSYIKKAWTAYGSVYQGASTPVGTTPVGTTPLLGGGGAPTPKAPFNAALEAQALHDSMDGVQLSSYEFWQVTDGLSSSEKLQVRTYFDAYLGEGANLCNWIEGDFMGGEEKKALAAWGLPNTASGFMSSNCEPQTPFYMQ